MGSLVSHLPDEKLPDRETCSLLSTIFKDLAEAHTHFASVARGLADVTSIVSPQQLTLILAATVQPTIQLALPPGQISPLAAPPPPPTETTAAGKQDMIKQCKLLILPNAQVDIFKEYNKRAPTRVLAGAIFCTLEKHLFDETMPRADVATAFCITTTQLHKAVMGIDYRSGPHHYKKRKLEGDEDPQPTQSTSSAGAQSSKAASDARAATPSEDTLTLSSSEDLLDVPL